ncbi:hypothetical protein EVAR_21959_1 [Eumeta japonica]|uniref:Uncharacterized protein n=1 Tax=Eumeta variegata TaxID=151549 RepID=A0A4C1VXN5_EUMVA|nr:hypothetical protein EVAR_21959_1 [Eumeta japonica]
MTRNQVAVQQVEDEEIATVAVSPTVSAALALKHLAGLESRSANTSNRLKNNQEEEICRLKDQALNRTVVMISSNNIKIEGLDKQIVQISERVPQIECKVSSGIFLVTVVSQGSMAGEDQLSIGIETCIRIESGTVTVPDSGTRIDIENRTMIATKIEKSADIEDEGIYSVQRAIQGN